MTGLGFHQSVLDPLCWLWVGDHTFPPNWNLGLHSPHQTKDWDCSSLIGSMTRLQLPVRIGAGAIFLQHLRAKSLPSDWRPGLCLPHQTPGI